MTRADAARLRDSDGKLPAVAFPGGYSVLYLRRQPGQRNSWLDWYIVGADELSAPKRAGYRAK